MRYGISLAHNESWTTFGALPVGAVFWDATRSEYLVRKIDEQDGRYLDGCGVTRFVKDDPVVVEA